MEQNAHPLPRRWVYTGMTVDRLLLSHKPKPCRLAYPHR